MRHLASFPASSRPQTLRVGRGLFFILRIACYLALLVLVGSMAGLVLAMSFGSCTQSGDSIACASSLAQVVANTASVTLLITSFTLVPLLLALGGIFFYIQALVRMLRRRRGAGV